jgi:PAS domain S-box-containing protein
MTLAKRTILIIVSTFIALLFILAATSDVILLKSYSSLERSILNDNVQKTRREIDETYEELFASAKDLSGDVVKYGAKHISGIDLQYFSNHRLDVLACFSNSGVLLSSRMADFHKGLPLTLSQEGIKHIGEVANLAVRSQKGILKGMVLIDNSPIQLVIRPVQGSDVLLLTGRYLDADEVGRVKELTHFDLSIMPISQKVNDADIIAALADFENGVENPSQILNDGKIAGYTLFRDPLGQPVAVGRIIEERSVFEQGKASIIYLIAALFLAGSIFCTVMLVFIRRMVIKRLELLGETVTKISNRCDISSRLPVSDEKDELTDLAETINAMLDSLESAESKLRESEERYRMLFERAPDSIIIIGMDGDEAGKIVAANQAAAEQHGYTVEELCTMTIFEINTPETNKDAGPLMEKIAKGEWVTGELWHRKKDGSQFPIEVHAGLIKISGRNYTLGFDRDITSRLLSEEADKIYMNHIDQLNKELNARTNALAAANAELETFNYSVSHDMRGPLTRISGYCQILLEEAENPDSKIKAYVTRIHDAGAWLNDMIDAMLSLSQLTNITFVPNIVNLSQIAETVLGELILTEPNRFAQTTIAQDVIVYGDPHLLKILMTNLLNNAWKYSSRQSRADIEFGVIRNDSGPVYFVRDNGAGFDMADADKLFRVFKRLHDPAQFSGTGVGLATVQRIIARHGGRIWAEGEVGRGATFFFALPQDQE